MPKFEAGSKVKFLKGDAVQYLRNSNTVNSNDVGTIIELCESWYRIRVNGYIRCIGFELADQVLEVYTEESNSMVAFKAIIKYADDPESDREFVFIGVDGIPNELKHLQSFISLPEFHKVSFSYGTIYVSITTEFE